MVKDKFIIYTGSLGTKKVLVIHQHGFYGNDKYFMRYINNTSKKLTKKTILELLDFRYGGYSSILLSIVKEVSKSYEVAW
jgi:hypothetical protein